MARRKKKKLLTPVGKDSNKIQEIFNPALRNLIPSIKKPENKLNGNGKQELPERGKEHTETQIFLEAMAGVKPLSRYTNRRSRDPNPNIRPSHPVKKEEQEAFDFLSKLLNGTAEMDITFSDEYIEGSVPGFSKKLMRRLKKGRFPIQDYVDIHGFTRRDAEVVVRDFLFQSYRMGLRSVLIVHGRGLNSENNIPVLKEQLPVWLSRGAVKKILLAFSTARPYDGGTGAIYILLKEYKVGT